MDYSKGLAKVAEVDKLAAQRFESIKNTPSDYSTITGTKYYVSNNGNDDNDGLSPETAWATTKKVNDFKFQDGDGILFERGGLWREVQMVQNTSRVTYSAYGEGPKPILSGSPENSADESKWELFYEDEQKKIWKFYREDLLDIGSIVFNDGEKYADKDMPSYIDNTWIVRGTEFDSQTPYDVKTALNHNLKFVHLADSVVKESGTPDVSKSTGPIYLRCDEGNPGKLFNSIEFIGITVPFIIRTHGVTIDNICIKYSKFGVSGYYIVAIEDLTVKNCEMEWIGGNLCGYNFRASKGGISLRIGNGVEVYGGCKNYTVENCRFYQIYDAAISPQYVAGGADSKESNVITDDILFKGNLIEYAIYGFESFLDTIRTGIIAKGDNYFIEDNIVRMSGCGFGSTRLDRGFSGGFTTGGHPSCYRNFRITNNIFDRASDQLVIACEKEVDCLPIFENNTYIQGYGNVLITKNCYDRNEPKYKCDENSEKILAELFRDNTSKVYIVPYIPPYEFPYK